MEALASLGAAPSQAGKSAGGGLPSSASAMAAVGAIGDGQSFSGP